MTASDILEQALSKRVGGYAISGDTVDAWPGVAIPMTITIYIEGGPTIKIRAQQGYGGGCGLMVEKGLEYTPGVGTSGPI